MGESHARAGVATWFVTAAAVTLAPAYTDVPLPTLDVWQVIYGSVMAGATAHSWLSPDADGHKVLGKLIPGGHRGPLHMPEVVAAIGGLMLWASWGSPARGTTLAVVVGWMSHVLTDAAFNKVPWVVLGGRRAGFTFDTDGVFERWIVRPLLLPLAVVAGVAAVWVSAGMPTVSSIQTGVARWHVELSSAP